MIEEFDFEQVIADRSYDVDEFLSLIAGKEAEAVIPPRKNRKEPREYDHHLYKERHLTECFFNKIKHYRRLFPDLKNWISACSVSLASLAL